MMVYRGGKKEIDIGVHLIMCFLNQRKIV
jgi:hypothetical protein